MEAKVLALSRDFNELLSEKMRAAILISTVWEVSGNKLTLNFLGEEGGRGVKA